MPRAPTISCSMITIILIGLRWFKKSCKVYRSWVDKSEYRHLNSDATLSASMWRKNMTPLSSIHFVCIPSIVNNAWPSERGNSNRSTTATQLRQNFPSNGTTWKKLKCSNFLAVDSKYSLFYKMTVTDNHSLLVWTKLLNCFNNKHPPPLHRVHSFVRYA